MLSSASCEVGEGGFRDLMGDEVGEGTSSISSSTRSLRHRYDEGGEGVIDRNPDETNETRDGWLEIWWAVF